MAMPRAKYILFATHYQERTKGQRWRGNAFREAAKFLRKKTNATIVTTMHAPFGDLAAAAKRFAVIGPKFKNVATLLVRSARTQ